MRWPWISRLSHESIAFLLTAQVEELKTERRMLLDRLATMVMGGPLYNAAHESTGDAEEEHSLLPDPAQELAAEMMRLRHRPARLADALGRRAHRERNSFRQGPGVAWIPQAGKIDAALDAALDAAEKTGRAQASAGETAPGS
jgi:hypothetical protein